MRPSKGEWLSAAVIVPLLAIILNGLLFKQQLLQSRDIWLYSLPCTIAYVFVLWYLYIYSIKWLRIRFANSQQTVKRVLLLAAIHSGIIVVAVSLLFYIYNAFHVFGYFFNSKDYVWAVIIGGAATLIVTPLREGIFLFQKWKESLVQKELMQQLSIKQEFELLKRQVDPHFLFNCFNTLSSLITEDIQRAHYFLKELRSVYHYLLSNKQEDFVPLEKELHFIQSYFALLQTRFGDAIELSIAVKDCHLDQYIPSLSLQLLVENAVKHNIVSKSKKLYITITSSTDEGLIITNNLQPKLIKGKSFGIGMETIRAKYSLCKQQFRVEESSGKYTVVLPFVQGSKTAPPVSV